MEAVPGYLAGLMDRKRIELETEIIEESIVEIEKEASIDSVQEDMIRYMENLKLETTPTSFYDDDWFEYDWEPIEDPDSSDEYYYVEV